MRFKDFEREINGDRQNNLLICGFILLIVLNIIFRVPLTPHEIGDDSFYIHDLTDSIIDSGSIKWAIHPLSYFGLYALSYPAGAPATFAMVSQVINIDISWSIYFASLLFALLGMFSTYLLAGEFFERRYQQLLAAFLFSLSPLSLKYTLWTGSARGLFLMLLPLQVWFFLRYAKTRDARYFILTAVIFALLASVHKMFPLIALILLGYVIASHLPNSVKRMNNYHLGCTLVIAYGLLFILPFVFIQNEWSTLYVSNYIPIGEGLHSHIVGAIITMGARLGLLIPLSVLGMAILLFKPKKQTEDWFLIVTTLLFTPLLFYEEYIYTFQLPLLVLLSLSGLLVTIGIFQRTFGLKSARAVLTCVLIVCVLITSFTLFIRYTNEHESGYGNYLYESTYSLAQYVQNTPGRGELTGDPAGTRQISAFVSNPTSLVRSVDLLIFDRIDRDSLDVSLGPLPRSPNEIAGFVRMPFDVKSNAISKEGPKYFVMSVRSGGRMTIDVSRYKIYDNAFDELWYKRGF